MKPRSAKNKGAKFQKDVRQTILNYLTNLESDDIKTAIMGESGVDLHLSPAAKKVFPFSVECKNQERLNVWESLSQAATNVKKDTYPALIFKRNRSKTYITLELEDFLEYVYKINKIHNKNLGD
jgi:hypothetical protein